MLDGLFFKLLDHLPPESSFLAVVMGVGADVKKIINSITVAACALILASAVIYGSWLLFEGFADSGSSSKHKGLVTLIGGVLMCGLIYTVHKTFFG